MADHTKYSRPIRWGIVGCGNVTEVKSGPAYKLVEGFELVAVMRRDLSKVKDYAKRHNIKQYYTNAYELINDKDVDAVYIATPPDTHLHYGLEVAKAGKPCCIEKPLAPSYKESLAIYESFKEKSLPLFVTYYRRSLPRFIQVKKWLEDHSIGEIRHVNWCLNKVPNEIDLSGEYNWRTDPKVAPGGYFDDLASHGLDLFAFFLGNIKNAYGTSLNQQNLYEAKDAVAACWQHENGITGTGNWNFGCSHNEEKVTIYGSEGKIEFSIFEEKPLTLNRNEKVQEVFIENPKHIQLHHVENMRDQLLVGKLKHPSNGLTATHTSWVMDNILGKKI